MQIFCFHQFYRIKNAQNDASMNVFIQVVLKTHRIHLSNKKVLQGNIFQFTLLIQSMPCAGGDWVTCGSKGRHFPLSNRCFCVRAIDFNIYIRAWKNMLLSFKPNHVLTQVFISFNCMSKQRTFWCTLSKTKIKK